MLRLITALTRSAIKKITSKNNKQQIKQKHGKNSISKFENT